MLGEAIRYLKSLSRDPIQRADAFEAMAKQIESHSGGALEGCAWHSDRRLSHFSRKAR